MREQWFAELLQYCDSVKAETGWLPDMKGVSFRGKQMSTYYNRYYVPEVANGDTIWHERPAQALSKTGAAVLENNHNGAPVPAALIYGTSPHPIAAEAIEIQVVSTIKTDVVVKLTTLQGESLGVVWRGFIGKGSASISASIPTHIANGTYLLSLEKNNGETISSKTVVVAR